MPPQTEVTTPQEEQPRKEEEPAWRRASQHGRPHLNTPPDWSGEPAEVDDAEEMRRKSAHMKATQLRRKLNTKFRNIFNFEAKRGTDQECATRCAATG